MRKSVSSHNDKYNNELGYCMDCAMCGKDDFTEVWIRSCGMIRSEQINGVDVSAQLSDAKVPLPGSEYPELYVGYPAITAEWYLPPPSVRTFACYHCGYVMTFLELNDEIKKKLDKLRRFQ